MIVNNPVKSCNHARDRTCTSTIKDTNGDERRGRCNTKSGTTHCASNVCAMSVAINSISTEGIKTNARATGELLVRCVDA